jgi:hypothetical protein
MSTRTYIKSLLLVSLTTLAIGGFFLHLRFHPFTEHAYGAVPFISGLLSILLVPCLFSFRKTLDYGYILNGLLVIIGTIAMVHFSISHWPQPVSFEALLLKTTLADILILWAKFFVGKAVFDLELHGYDSNPMKEGASWRYPHLGWWMIHVAVISAVYGLGNLLWR